MKDAKELGMVVRDIVPGMDDLDDEALLGEVMGDLLGIKVRDTEHEERAHNRLADIEKSLDDDQGVIGSFFTRRGSEGRTKRNAQLIHEMDTILQIEAERAALNDQVWEATHREDLRQYTEAESEAYSAKTVAQYKNEIVASTIAARLGVSPTALDQIVITREQVIAETTKEKELLVAKLTDQQERDVLAREQKKELDALELNKERQAAYDEIEANFVIQHGSDQFRIEVIQKQLDKLYVEIDLLETEQPAGWKHKLKDRKKTVKALQRSQDGLRQGLLQDNQQKALVGASAEADDPRDPR